MDIALMNSCFYFNSTKISLQSKHSTRLEFTVKQRCNNFCQTLQKTERNQKVRVQNDTKTIVVWHLPNYILLRSYFWSFIKFHLVTKIILQYVLSNIHVYIDKQLLKKILLQWLLSIIEFEIMHLMFLIISKVLILYNIN